MKLFNRTAAVIVLSMIASTAFAGGLTGSVGVASNYLNEGVLDAGTQKINPSLNAAVRFDGKSGLFGDADVNVIDMAAGLGDVAYRTELGLGYARTMKNSPIGYGVRVSRVNYFNGDMAANMDVTAVTGWMTYATANGGQASASVKQVVASSFGNDRYIRVGYTMPVTKSLALSVAASVKQYDNADVTRYNNTAVSAVYSLNKATSVSAVYSLGGKDAADDKISNQTIVGLDFAF